MSTDTLRGTTPEIRELFREVVKHDWTIRRRRSGHYVLQSPTGEKVFCSGTASDHRVVKNIKRDLARYGLDLR